MREPITDRDTGDENDNVLFDADTTLPKKCSCGVTKKNLCRWASNRHFAGIDTPQPRTCLLRYSPETAAIPY